MGLEKLKNIENVVSVIVTQLHAYYDNNYVFVCTLH